MFFAIDNLGRAERIIQTLIDQVCMQGLGKKFEFRLFMSNMKVRCGSSVFFTRVIETWEAGSSNQSDTSGKCYSRCSGKWAHHVA